VHPPEVLGALPHVVVRPVAPPDDLVAETGRAEDGVHHDLEVVARRGVTVKVEAPSRLEDPVQLHKSGRHHHQVGHHLVGADKLPERFDGLAHLCRALGH
jgi:hypothetical protein